MADPPLMTPAGDWRVLAFEVGAPEQLLERGVALLDSLSDEPVPTLRWYRSSRPAIVLGRGQGDIAARAATGTDLPVVARHSGGGAVLMDDDLLSLDVLLPAGHAWLAGGPGPFFIHVGRCWAAALGALGVPELAVHRGASTATRRGDARQRLLAAVCYATLGRGEVTAGGRKLVGLAQRRRRAGALVQCGLVRRWHPASLLSALGYDPDDVDVQRAAVGLDELLDPPPDDDEIIESVGVAFRDHD